MRVACIVIPHLQAEVERILPEADALHDCKVFRQIVDGLMAISDRVEAAAAASCTCGWTVWSGCTAAKHNC